MYNPQQPQDFTVVIRFSNPHADPSMWTNDFTLTRTAYAPSFEFIGSIDFELTNLRMGPNQTVLMELIDARWSLSPQKGREQWDVVEAEVRNERKIGRNEPCPCGSGKKYKHCHGRD